jgi:hypothetical protein
MAKRNFYKLHVQKRIEAHGSASVNSESVLGHPGLPNRKKTSDILQKVTGEIDLPWTRPLQIQKSKVKGKKHSDRLPVDRSAKILQLKAKPDVNRRPV